MTGCVNVALHAGPQMSITRITVAALVVAIRLTFVVAFGVGPAATVVAAAQEFAAEPPTPIGDLLTLQADVTKSPIRVRFRGVVTWRSEIDGLWALVVQDDTGGIWVSLQKAIDGGTWRGVRLGPADVPPGTEVEIVGTIVPGGYKPSILPETIERVGRHSVPKPILFDPDALYGGSQDCLLVEVAGVVQGVSLEKGEWRFVIDSDGKRCLATIPRQAFSDDPSALVDAEVALKGVATYFFNQRGELLSPRILMNARDDLDLCRPPPEDPFSVIRLPLATIARYRPDLWSGHRIVTEGTVIYAQPGKFFFIQDGAVGVRVQTSSQEPIAIGQRLEVAGFLDMGQPVAALYNAVFRRAGTVVPPDPISVDPSAIIKLNNEASFYGERAEPGDYHGCLVKFAARVAESHAVSDGGVVTLVAGKETVGAWCSPADFASIQRIQPGSEVQVTGVVYLERMEKADRIGSLAWPLVGRLRLFVRSPADMILLRGPSWWTPRRLATALAAVAGVAGLAILWGASLRRQVVQQLAVIERQLKREAAMEERRRIASEFHDTLEQDLAGVALRLDVASGRTEDTAAREVLEQQRGLITRIRTETREFLWDLRDSSRRDGSLRESLQAQVAYMQSFTSIPLRLQCGVGCPLVTPLVQHHVLRFAREAITNALRHALATEVVITLREVPGGILLEVADDGQGFDVDSRGDVVGHFGIRGMRERARRINAEMTIDSSGGRGTRIGIRVPLTEEQPWVEADRNLPEPAGADRGIAGARTA
jgi:signal transduction histidine kinase